MKRIKGQENLGLQRALGSTYESLALFRIFLGSFLLLELVLRYRFLHPFYSDEGTLPLHLLLDKVDDLYKLVCTHCHFGSLWQQQVLLSFQVMIAVLFTLGYKTTWTAPLSWYLYLSLTLRNTWMSYILDRYFHYLLFLSMFLPLQGCWALSPHVRKKGIVLSPGTIALKALVFWIYLDAGWGKYMDPLKGWTYNADPLPALDTYARHTVVARYLYALLGPEGLRIMTPTVVYIELLACPLALLASYACSKKLLYTSLGLIWSLHIGIAATLRNSALLSFVACVAWLPFVPIGWIGSDSFPPIVTRRNVISLLLIVAMISGNLWLETISRACDQSVKHIWSTLLHNRWNVFVGAEEYVTWEIAPGLLRDGSVVDVWGRSDEVNWALPGGGAPCTATARPGRWRSFPYLAGLEGEDRTVLWSYLCNEWNREHHIDDTPGRELIKFNFFMLQADVLPNMGFSETRKRLIESFECTSMAHNTTDTAGGDESSASEDDTRDEL